MNLQTQLIALLPVNLLTWPPIGQYDPRRIVTVLSSGENDIYTCPAGKKALVGPCALYNAGAGAVSVFPQIKEEDGEYYRLSGPISVSVGVRSAAFTQIYVLEPGQKFAFSTDGALNAGLPVAEIDEAIPFKSLIIELTALQTAIYTCPVGKRAITFRYDQPIKFPALAGGQLINESGATRSYKSFVTPSGGSPIQQMPAISVPNNTGQYYSVDCFLETGDTIVIETDDTTEAQYAFVTVLEVEA